METDISMGIIQSYFEKLKESLNLDVAIAGAGPSGLLAAYYLAKSGADVAVFERKLAPGGGMWGGAMMFNEIVVQEDALSIIKELGMTYRHYKNSLYLIDSVHATSTLIAAASKAGARIFNGISIEDVVFLEQRIQGIVINWGSVEREGMHVDPLSIRAKAVLDGTGHDCEIARVVERKNGIQLFTESGKVMGERSLSVEIAEKTSVENTKEIYPGLFVSGMAANGVNGGFRMGPIFGGMLLSGQKVASLINKSI